ncbi:PH domain-containing protein [Microbulbifer sp. ANSA001]|uniref:PH domain-containing protein n=1 Tax=Microbulbifer sp. ANSA001 TaxID=3243358 RepID=UPI00404280ED
MPSAVFQAPWSRQLKIISTISAALLLAIPLFLMTKAPPTPSLLFSIALALPPAILLLGALFMVRGYVIQNNNLFVLRLGWRTRIPLQDLRKASADPSAMQGSIRIFGNSGLFGYTGLFQNKKLGRYRAFATDHDKAVVLNFPTKTLVITPDRPERMAEILNRHTS